jgi:oligoribonuclease NrnB/cAMP/cGMP phosphodiesterase (DHH superfamily)
MLINSGNKRVYFRKQNEVDVDLGKLAASLCSGGGHKNAAGGVLNDTIKILSKDFQPL